MHHYPLNNGRFGIIAQVHLDLARWLKALEGGGSLADLRCVVSICCFKRHNYKPPQKCGSFHSLGAAIASAFESVVVYLEECVKTGVTLRFSGEKKPQWRFDLHKHFTALHVANSHMEHRTITE